MTRNLSLEDYGTVISLISIIMMPALVSSSVVPTVINFGATYFAKNDLSMVKGMFYKITKPLVLIGALILALFIIFDNQIAVYFQIKDTRLILLAGMTIFVTFTGATVGALLQAKLSFHFISFINILASLVKLIAGVTLILMGYKTLGAMWTVFLSFSIPLIISFYPIRFIFKKDQRTQKIDTKSLIKYGIPAAITAFSLTSLITTDIILVKHFFTPIEAGLYSVLSLIGRVIFFLSAPIGQVMFPLIVQKYTKDEDYKSIFFMAILLVLVPAVGMTGFYFLFPEFTIQFFNQQKESLKIAPLLGYFGLMISFYTVVTVLTNFFLSIKKTFVVYPLSFAALVQIILISFFHNSFLQIITTTFIIVSLLLLSLLVYYTQLHRGKEKK